MERERAEQIVQVVAGLANEGFEDLAIDVVARTLSDESSEEIDAEVEEDFEIDSYAEEDFEIDSYAEEDFEIDSYAEEDFEIDSYAEDDEEVYGAAEDNFELEDVYDFEDELEGEELEDDITAAFDAGDRDELQRVAAKFKVNKNKNKGIRKAITDALTDRKTGKKLDVIKWAPGHFKRVYSKNPAYVLKYLTLVQNFYKKGGNRKMAPAARKSIQRKSIKAIPKIEAIKEALQAA